MNFIFLGFRCLFCLAYWPTIVRMPMLTFVIRSHAFFFFSITYIMYCIYTYMPRCPWFFFLHTLRIRIIFFFFIHEKLCGKEKNSRGKGEASEEWGQKKRSIYVRSSFFCCCPLFFFTLHTKKFGS